MSVEIRPGLAFAALVVASLLLVMSLMFVSYANGVADAAYRHAQTEEATNG